MHLAINKLQKWKLLTVNELRRRMSRLHPSSASTIVSESSSTYRESSALIRFEIDYEKARKGFEWEIKYNKTSLWILGLWPLDDKYKDVKFSLCFILLVLNTLPSIARLVLMGSERSINDTLRILMEIIPFVYTILQFSVLKYNSHKISIILTAMHFDWSRSTIVSEDYKKPMLAYGSRTRIITVLIIICLVTSGIGYAAAPLITMLIKGNAGRSLPNKGIYPFDTDPSPNYHITYVVQVLIGTLCAITFISTDGFLMLSVFHGCGQLAVLCRIIDDYDDRTRHVSVSSVDSKMEMRSQCSCLKCIVDRHVFLSEYATTVDEIFNVIIMARLIVNTTYFCGAGYLVIKSNESTKYFHLLMHFIFMATMIFNFYMYCWIGEQLLKEGENVGRAMCKLDWLRVELKVAQSFLLPILRSRRPLKLTAARFFVMSHSFFKEWITSTAGYLSVLLAIETRA